jgi:alkylation response protein AidB-like acyl-CoA dehydrogenase
VTVPEAYGGIGLDVPAMITTIEVLASRSLALAGLYVMVACYGGLNITGSGSERQKQRFLPDLAAGKLRLAYDLHLPVGPPYARRLQDQAAGLPPDALLVSMAGRIRAPYGGGEFDDQALRD